MAKKNKNESPSTAPRQQQTPIESRPSEELALLLGEQYKMLMQCQNNIAAINNILQQRQQARQLEKDKANGNAGN